MIKIHEYTENDNIEANIIWNEVVDAGKAFPQLDDLDEKTGPEFFQSQTYTGIAADGDETVGLYILHPNNIGRCGHIANASFAVKSNQRGRHIGEILVKDCLAKAKRSGYKILQLNAVVKSNTSALRLYKKMGFTQLGTIPKGFLNKDGVYEDIVVHYIEL